MKKKLSDKDLKDWKKFIKSKDKINPKDESNQISINKSKFVIDLHGYGLDQANKFVEKTINECFEKQFSIVNIITGKGMRSKSTEDPYKSSELSILKNSIHLSKYTCCGCIIIRTPNNVWGQSVSSK